MTLLYIAIGGALGALARYGITSGVTQLAGTAIFPWGTLSVNLIGSLVIGLLWGVLDHQTLSVPIRGLIFIGLLGSFTTFSSFSLEVMNLLKAGETLSAIGYVLVSNVLGIALAFGGYGLGKM